MLGVPRNATGVFIWEDAQGILQLCPCHLLPAFPQSGFCFLWGVMVCFEGFKVEGWEGHVAASDAP